jgi:hypothetical protein
MQAEGQSQNRETINKLNEFRVVRPNRSDGMITSVRRLPRLRQLLALALRRDTRQSALREPKQSRDTPIARRIAVASDRARAHPGVTSSRGTQETVYPPDDEWLLPTGSR